MSICESMANIVKRAFHAKECINRAESVTHFDQIWEELDQDTIKHCYHSYNDRLFACRAAGGQMTKY